MFIKNNDCFLKNEMNCEFIKKLFSSESKTILKEKIAGSIDKSVEWYYNTANLKLYAKFMQEWDHFQFFKGELLVHRFR